MQNGFLLIKTLIDYILIIYFAQNLALNNKMANKKKYDANFKNLITDLKSARKIKQKNTLLPDTTSMKLVTYSLFLIRYLFDLAAFRPKIMYHILPI